jgi:selenide,water dikinase
VRLVFVADALPLYRGALVAAEAGVRTGGDGRNRANLVDRVVVGAAVGDAIDAIAHDPQTSGGLLAAVDAAVAHGLVAAGVGFVEVGVVEEGAPGVELR